MGGRRAQAWLGAFVLALLVSVPATGQARPQIGVRVFGAPSKVAAPLAQALRDAIVEGEAELISIEALREAEQSLGIAKSNRESEESLLRGAAAAGATHLLVVRLARKGRRYQASIEFFDVAAGVLRSKGSLRWDRSKRSARRLAGPLVAALLTKTKPEETAPEPAAEDAAPVSDTTTSTSTSTKPDSEPAVEETAPEPEPAAEDAAPEPEPVRVPAAIAHPAPPPSPAASTLQLTLSAGSTLLRRYQLTAGTGVASDLSHTLVASALFAGELELRWPWPVLGLWARAWLSPLRYQVNIDGVLSEQPAGFLLGSAAQLRLHLALSEELRLMPGLGARFDLTRVEPHRGNFIVSQLGFAPEAGLALCFTPSRALDLSAGISGGYLLLFRESPVGSGAPGPGFVAAADLGARWWVTGAFGLGFDARLDLMRLGFEGAADRQVPEGEIIVSPSLSTLDLRVQLGVALRL